MCQVLHISNEELDWHPRHNTISNPFMEHLLETNDVRVAIEMAAGRQGVVVQDWLDERTLKSSQMKDYVTITGPRGGKVEVAVVPDGYFYLQTPDYDFRFFLEVDRGTITAQWDVSGRRSWDRKIRAYLEYYDSGKYEERYGSTKGRVLTVTSSQERLETLKTITEEAGGKDWFWFTTFDQVAPETVLTARIWQVATIVGLVALV